MARPVVQSLSFPDSIEYQALQDQLDRNSNATVMITCWAPHPEDGQRINQRLGTGIMISRRRMITNNHVLSTPEIAYGRYEPGPRNSQNQPLNLQTGAVSGFRVGLAPVSFPIKFLPNLFWYTNPSLDYTIVEVDTDAVDFVRPTCPPFRRLQDAEKPIYALSHPGGRCLQFSGAGKRVSGCQKYREFMWLTLEIHPGSSGGGVYDMHSGELIGLINAEIPGLIVNQAINIKSIWRDVYDQKLINLSHDQMYNNLQDVRNRIVQQDVIFCQSYPDEFKIPDTTQLHRLTNLALGWAVVVTPICAITLFTGTPVGIPLGIATWGFYKYSHREIQQVKIEEDKILDQQKSLQLTY
jgi:hypothetical protein